MYNFVIDTDSEKLSSVSIYTDKEKTRRLAAPLDAVGRFAQSVKVAFIGSRKPTEADTLRLVVSWDGLVDNILQSSDSEALRAYIAQAGTPDVSEPDTWTFPVRLESAALEAALAQHSKITLRAAVVVENEAAGTHVEYHFAVGAVASIFAGAAADPQTAPIEFARVKRLSWAEYQALETPESNVLYYVEDAPSETTQHAFGYLGTLRALGAFGDAVDVRRLCVYSRSSGTIASGSIAVWARILKIENDTWTVAAQSENSVKWNDYGLNAEIPFEMVPVAGITPPNADEAVAIVFVNDPAAAAGTSNGRLSFRTVSLHGGLQHALNAPDNLNAGQAWSPRIKLRFAPLAGTQIHATQERLAVLEAKVATLEAALNVATLSFPTMQTGYEVPSVTQHGTLVTVGTLPTAGGSYVIHVLGVNRETLNATCEADWVSNVQTQASVFWDENTNKGCILFDVAPNDDPAPRSATITLTSSALNEVYTIQISQI